MQTAFFTRQSGEDPAELGARLRVLAEKLASDPASTLVILHVADDATGAPAAATSDERPFDAALTVDGVTLADAAEATDAAVYEVDRRIIKHRGRVGGGARTPGFTLVCPTARKQGMTHEEFDDHWREQHARVHVENSPGTSHYEQFPVSAKLTAGAPDYDGFTRLSFDSRDDFEHGLFAGEEGERNIYADVERFVDPPTLLHSWAVSEYVYKDPATT